MGGSRTVGTASPTAVTASGAGDPDLHGEHPSKVPSTGTPDLTIQGVVAGSTWETRWGVATISGTGSPQFQRDQRAGDPGPLGQADRPVRGRGPQRARPTGG